MAESLGRIIIIDSDMVGSFALRSLLRGQGFDACSIENAGEEDEFIAHLSDVSLVIIDTAVPDAVGLSSRIMATQNDIDIFYTTVSMRAEEELYRKVKFAKVFLKPFPLGLLLQAVKGSVGQHHHRTVHS